MGTLMQAWAVERRVLGALFMREIHTRWGRRNLSFAWLFAEPLVFAFPVLVMWSILRPPYEPGGIQLIPFLWSGYLPLLIFRHVTGHAVYPIRNNGVLLYHRAITPLDIVVARCGLEMFGNLSAVAVSFFVMYALGFIEWPYDPALVMVGILYMAWWSFSVSLIIAPLSERTEIIEHVWPVIGYMYMPISGFFYLAQWLPESVRNVALTVLPSLHSYEMIRSGLFGNHIVPYYDAAYLTYILVTLTVIGLALLRGIRHHIAYLDG